MQEAGKQLHQVLSAYELKTPRIPVLHNLTARIADRPLIDLLSEQISHSVLLEDTIRNMLADGVDTFIEVGPGKAVSGFVKKCAKGMDVNILHVDMGQANYAASKGGVIALTKSCAKELASRGIRVNAVAPGFIATAMTDKLADSVKESALASIPMKKFGAVQDVANVVKFLCSEDSTYITGQVIAVDGGMVM